MQQVIGCPDNRKYYALTYEQVNPHFYVEIAKDTSNGKNMISYEFEKFGAPCSDVTKFRSYKIESLTNANYADVIDCQDCK